MLWSFFCANPKKLVWSFCLMLTHGSGMLTQKELLILLFNNPKNLLPSDSVVCQPISLAHIMMGVCVCVSLFGVKAIYTLFVIRFELKQDKCRIWGPVKYWMECFIYQLFIITMTFCQFSFDSSANSNINTTWCLNTGHVNSSEYNNISIHHTIKTHPYHT